MAGEADDAPVESGSRRWWQGLNFVALLVGAVVTTAVTLLGSYAYARFTDAQPRLRYDVVPTPELFGPLEDARIFTITVENEGNRSADDVRIGVSTRRGTIGESDVEKPPALDLRGEVQADGTEYVATAPRLNPDDSVRISLIIEDIGADANLSVDVRGADATGTARTASDDGDDNRFVALIASAASVLGVAFALTATRRSREVVESVLPKVSPRFELSDAPRGAIIAHYMLTEGLLSEATQFLERSDSTRWWVEAQYLADLALNGTDDRVRRYLNVLLKLGDDEVRMAATSRAIVFVQAARLAKRLGDEALVSDLAQQATEANRSAAKRFAGIYPDLPQIS